MATAKVDCHEGIWTSENENNGKKLRKLLTRSERSEYEIFHEKFSKDPAMLYQELNKHRKTIKKLRSDKKLSPGEYFKIFPKNNNLKETNSQTFDSPVFTKLIANFCGLTSPKTGWTALPDAADQSREAQIVRLTIGRHMIQHATGHVTDAEYKKISKLMIDAMVALGVDRKEFDNLLPPKTFGIYPPINNFSGREKEIDEIHSIVEDKQGEQIRIVIHAMPGMGKSETARKYYEKHGAYFDGNILWINSSTTNSVEKAFKDIGEINNLSIKDENGNFKEITAIVHTVHEYFRNDKVLYIFDDAVSMKSVIEFLPNYQPSCTLITTQSTNWKKPEFRTFELPNFTSDDSDCFIRDNLNVVLTDQHIDEVLLILGGHPLALQQFVAFINETMMGCNEYISRFKAQTAKILLSELSTTCGDISAIKTIQIAIERISLKENFKLAYDMVNVISLLYGDEISFQVLNMIFDTDDEIEVEAAIKQLCSLSLVTKRKINGQHIITVHSLVQKTLLFQQENMNTHEKCIQMFLKMFILQLTNESSGVSHCDFGKDFHKHFINIINLQQAIPFILSSCENNLQVIDSYLEGKGCFEELLRINQELLRKYETTYGSTQTETLKMMSRLSLSLKRKGDLKAAITLNQECLEQRISTLGPSHPQTLTSMNNLAECLKEKGDLAEAIKLHQECSEQRNSTHGPSHPDTISSLNNLAECLRKKGDLDGAIELLQECLEKRKFILGPSHSDTLSSMDDLAGCLRKKGDLEGAINLRQECLKQYISIFGHSHPQTFIGVNNLAGCLKQRGDLEGAIKLCQECLEQRNSILGPSHPQTLSSINNLAECLRDKGDFKGAIELHRECLERRNYILGPSHPDTFVSINNLAKCLRKKGDLEEATKIRQDCLKQCYSIFGPSHHQTLTSMSDLAICLRGKGDLEAAIKLNQECLEQRIFLLGPSHKDTLTSMDDLAGCRREKGDLEGAINLRQESLEQHISFLGPSHPHTLISMNNLAACLTEKGDLGGAIKLRQECLEQRISTHGLSHPKTLTSMSKLARCLKERGDLKGSIKLNQECLEQRISLLGHSHPQTLTSMDSLAGCLKEKGDLEGAIKLYEECLEQRNSIIGPSHRKTVKTRNDLTACMREQQLKGVYHVLYHIAVIIVVCFFIRIIFFQLNLRFQ